MARHEQEWPRRALAVLGFGAFMALHRISLGHSSVFGSLERSKKLEVARVISKPW